MSERKSIKKPENPELSPWYGRQDCLAVTPSTRLIPICEVFDGQANLLHRQSLDLPVDQDGTHKIIPEINFPKGIIHHRFTFEDGSHSSYTTLKQ